MRVVIVIFLTSILISSCDDSQVHFENSQPEGKKELPTFSKKLKGVYKDCFNANLFLQIEETRIRQQQQFQLKSHIKDVETDSNGNINRKDSSQLKKHLEAEGWEISIQGDTVVGAIEFEDKLFEISENNVLKKFKGAYFLNIKRKDNTWSVSRIETRKDSLFIGQITPSDSLLNFKFISKMQQDSSASVEYLVQSNKRELNQLIKNNFFEEVECYCKIKNQ